MEEDLLHWKYPQILAYYVTMLSFIMKNGEYVGRALLQFDHQEFRSRIHGDHVTDKSWWVQVFSIKTPWYSLAFLNVTAQEDLRLPSLFLPQWGKGEKMCESPAPYFLAA